MFSLHTNKSSCARHYAQKHSRSRRCWRVRRNTAKQSIKVSREYINPNLA